MYCSLPQYLSKTNEVEAAHNEVNKLERQLRDNLLRRKAEIEQKLAVDDSGGGKQGGDCLVIVTHSTVLTLLLPPRVCFSTCHP